MPKVSAGLLLFRKGESGLEVLLAHPGGPFWTRKDNGAWTIPKGELCDGEDPLAAAQREFEEEMGAPVTGEFLPLRPIRQAAGKLVHAWALRAPFDPAQLKSNTFSMEWPPRSGNQRMFPEVDRAAWFPLSEARVKMLNSQTPLLDQLVALIGA